MGSKDAKWKEMIIDCFQFYRLCIIIIIMIIIGFV